MPWWAIVLLVIFAEPALEAVAAMLGLVAAFTMHAYDWMRAP